jgi:V/A-type H+-transporting ATPase subunit K
MGLWLSIAGIAAGVILSGIGSATGIGLVGRTSAGILSEDPKMFGRLIILIALPGTQGIYGFVAAFLAMVKAGLLGGAPVALTSANGWQIFFACMPIAFAGLISAIHQGRVCAAGAGMVAKQPGEAGRALVIGVFVEFYAVLGLLTTIFLLTGIKL